MDKLFKFVLIIVILCLSLLIPDNALAVDIYISDPVTVDGEVSIEVSIANLTSKNCPNTKCFLQGMFTSSGEKPQYFGYTLNNYGDWYEYIGSPDKNFITAEFFYFEPENGSWSGQIKVKNNVSDSDYKGPGDYVVRVKRYTGNSTSSTSEVSNDLSVHLDYVLPTATPTETPTVEPTLTPTATPTQTPTIAPLKTKTPTPKPSRSPSPSPDVLSESTEAGNLVLGDASPSSSPFFEETSSSSGFPVFAVVLIALGVGVMGFAGYLAKKISYNERI